MAAFVVFLLASYKRTGTKTSGGPTDDVAARLVSELKGERDQLRLRDFSWEKTRSDGRDRLRAAEALGLSDRGEQVLRLLDARFESRDEGGRTVTLLSPRAEFKPLSKAVRVFEGFRIEGEGTAVRGDSFRYDPNSREFLSDGPVTALRERLLAHADSGSVETRNGKISLAGNVSVRGEEESNDPIEMTAPRAELSRNGTITAHGGVIVKTGKAVLRGESLDRTVEESGDRLRTQRGATLLLLPKDQLEAPLLARGDEIELARDAEGHPTRLVLTSTGVSRIDLAPRVENPARTALSTRFDAAFQTEHLREVTSPGALEAREAGIPGGAPGSGMKTLRAGFGRLLFTEIGTLDVATFEKGVHLADGTRASLESEQGTIRAADDTGVFVGLPGRPAQYVDEKSQLTADSISYQRREERVFATGSVKARTSGTERAGLPGSSPGDPFFSESDTFELLGSGRKMTLSGNVRAWQKDNVLRCKTLALDDAERTLRAEGDVHAFLRRKLEGKGVVKGASETVNASGNVLSHREADRLVRIEGQSTIVSGGWFLSSDLTDIRLSAEHAVEWAEARGTVVLEDRQTHRRGEGNRATWRPQTDAVTLNGAPATAVDEKGNRITGDALTFRQGKRQVDVESGEKAIEAIVKPPEGP